MGSMLVPFVLPLILRFSFSAFRAFTSLLHLLPTVLSLCLVYSPGSDVLLPPSHLFPSVPKLPPLHNHHHQFIILAYLPCFLVHA